MKRVFALKEMETMFPFMKGQKTPLPNETLESNIYKIEESGEWEFVCVLQEGTHILKRNDNWR